MRPSTVSKGVMVRLDIAPLSVNKAWKGRRFKTNAYKTYEKEVSVLLKPMVIPDGNLRLDITFGFSNKRSDIDNPCKLFIDILQKKYGFNDSRIYLLAVNKIIVAKGKEYIDFSISECEFGIYLGIA